MIVKGPYDAAVLASIMKSKEGITLRQLRFHQREIYPGQLENKLQALLNLRMVTLVEGKYKAL